MPEQEKTIPSVNPKTESIKEPEADKKPEKKASGNGYILFLMLLTVGAGVAAAIYLWDLQQKQVSILQEQQQSIIELKKQLEKTIMESNGNSKLLVENTAQLVSLSEGIQKTELISQRAMKVVNRSQRGWAIAEIDYLLRIAHQRIAIAKDIAGAIAALKGADARLQQLGDLNLFKIREQLVKDIGRLNAIHQADVNGISLTLDQLISLLTELPFKTVKDEIKKQFTPDDVVEPLKTEDKTFIDSVLETVMQVGDIKMHQRSIEVASSVEQQKEIEQLLRTYLLSARLAALQFDQLRFQHEINKSSEIIGLHYDENDNRIQQMQKTLREYSAVQLNPDLPELIKAWTMLQEVIKGTDKAEIKVKKQESK